MYQLDKYLAGEPLTDFVEYVSRATESEKHYDILALVLSGGDAKGALIKLFEQYEQDDKDRAAEIHRENAWKQKYYEQKYIEDKTIKAIWGE